MEKKELYTLREVETIVKVSQRTLYNWIKSGKLKAKKVGGQYRVSPKTIEELLKD